MNVSSIVSTGVVQWIAHVQEVGWLPAWKTLSFEIHGAGSLAWDFISCNGRKVPQATFKSSADAVANASDGFAWVSVLGEDGLTHALVFTPFIAMPGWSMRCVAHETPA